MTIIVGNRKGLSSGGGTPNPDPIDLQDGEMLRFNQTSGEMEGSGDINTDLEVNFGTKILRAATGAFDSGSIDMVGYQLNERGGYLQTVSKTTGRTFISLDYQVGNNGTQKPIYDSRGALITRQVKQADDTQTIVGLASYDIVPDTSQDISQVYFNFVNPVDNFRARITSDVTGEVVSYIPSRSAFDKGEGLSLTAGEQTFSPETVLPELVGFTLTVEVFADQSIDVLGDAIGNPWRAVDVQDIISLQMVDESDIALESVSNSLVSGCVISQASPTTINIGDGVVRQVTLDALGNATVTKTNVGPFLNVPVPDVLVDSRSQVTLNAALLPEVFSGVLTDLQLRTNIIVGYTTHPQGVIDNIRQASLKETNTYSQFVSSLLHLGVFRSGELGVTPNTGLTINKTAGFLTFRGAGNAFNSGDENTVAVNAQTPAEFTTFLGATGDFIQLQEGATAFDPTFWDNGTGAKVLIAGSQNQATNVYLFQSPVESGGLFYGYGQNLYPTLQDAIINRAREAFVIPEEVAEATNLIAIVSITAEATNMQIETAVDFATGPKFGVDRGGISGASGAGGGDVLGSSDSELDELPTYADTSGKVVKSSSNVSAVGGALKGIGATLKAESISFPAGGDSLAMPSDDGFDGDSITTDGAGGLTLNSELFNVITTNATLDYADKLAVVDSSAGQIILSLGDLPREGERKRIWLTDTTNSIRLVTANPTYPLRPPQPIAEANIQGLWSLTSDFLDRFSTDRDLTNLGTGGAFVPVTVNGDAVNAFDTQGTAYLSPTTSGYLGVLGTQPRSVTLWYGANSGAPTEIEELLAYGTFAAQSRWQLRVQPTNSVYVGILNRSVEWDLDGTGINLFDGNMHHIAVSQSGTNTNTCILYIDGVEVPITGGTFGNMDTIGDLPMQIGAQEGTRILDGKLYDVRLYNKALSETEVLSVLNQNILGDVELSGLGDNAIVDVVFDGTQWRLADKIYQDLLSIDSDVESLDAARDRITSGSASAEIDGSGNILIEGSTPKITLDSPAGVATLFEFREDGGLKAQLEVNPADDSISLAVPSASISLSDSTGEVVVTATSDVDITTPGNLTINGSPILVSGVITSPAGSLALSGINRDVTTGSMDYRVSDSTETAPFLDGVFTCEFDGTYHFWVNAFITSATAVFDDKVAVFLSKNSSDFDTSGTIQAETKSWVAANADGSFDLVAGDTVRLRYYVVDDVNWTMSRFQWGFNKV